MSIMKLFKSTTALAVVLSFVTLFGGHSALAFVPGPGALSHAGVCRSGQVGRWVPLQPDCESRTPQAQAKSGKSGQVG